MEHVGEQALGFCISIMVCIGSFFWFIYGSFGLTSLPFQLIKGYKSLEEERVEIDSDMGKLKERYRGIQEKYAKKHYKITKHDQKTLVNLKKREKVLNGKADKLRQLEGKQKAIQTILRLFAPVRSFVGFFFLAISLLIYASFATTLYERVSHCD